MYKVVFKYANGKKGVCIENGEILLFETEQEAVAFASDLNSVVTDETRDFFPVWSAEKA